jgi:hypothetical protein
MNPINILIGIYGLYKLISLLTESKLGNELPIAYSEITKVKDEFDHEHSNIIILPSYNYSNGVYIQGSLLNYYKELLNLNKVPKIDLDVIYDHFENKIESIDNAKNLGLSINYNINDLIAAREYMFDLCKYFGNRN